MLPMDVKIFLLIFTSSKFQISCKWEELNRKLVQNKKETAKVTFKAGFVWMCHNKLSFTLRTIILCKYRVFVEHFQLK